MLNLQLGVPSKEFEMKAVKSYPDDTKQDSGSDRMVAVAYRIIDRTIKLSKVGWMEGSPPKMVVDECKRLGIVIEYSYAQLAA